MVPKEEMGNLHGLRLHLATHIHFMSWLLCKGLCQTLSFWQPRIGHVMIMYAIQWIHTLIWQVHMCKNVFVNSHCTSLTWSPVTKRLPELLHSTNVMQAECVLGTGVWSPEGCVSSTTSPFSQPRANTGFVGCQRSTAGWWGCSKWQLSTCSPCVCTMMKYAHFFTILHKVRCTW